MIVVLAQMERVYPELPERMRQWKSMAKHFGVDAVEDEELAAERLERQLAAVDAEFGGDDEFVGGG